RRLIDYTTRRDTIGQEGRARYHGLPKVRLQHAFSAAALNIVRLDAYWTDRPLGRNRSSRLERLAYRPFPHALRCCNFPARPCSV
ncbi:hypothetical protein ABT187_46885, partial [Streptomyces sp. NPDC001817]|uniref:hypothetical protein n=1 Tax=Streptomyces sp. NPDC001817 TaxID=3154398 RepID=UPI003332BA4C